mmetsp:Transcript_5445/g.9196  ORF Transcript_5445/g.9196 Transcript_5445/m.9196 type:complete len:132 (+) Transcript_5445:1700-2095(+)
MENGGGSEEQFVTLILLKLPQISKSGFGQRFRLIVPEGFGLQTLRRLVYSGSRAIGLNEYLSIMSECGSERVFPQDYPETLAGMSWVRSMSLREKLQKHALKPPSKRVNFQILKQQYPFGRFDLSPKGPSP